MKLTRNEAERAIDVIQKRFHLMQVKFNGGLTEDEAKELRDCQTLIESIQPELRSAAANEVTKRRAAKFREIQAAYEMLRTN